MDDRFMDLQEFLEKDFLEVASKGARLTSQKDALEALLALAMAHVKANDLDLDAAINRARGTVDGGG